jgi:hypothetical protein
VQSIAFALRLYTIRQFSERGCDPKPLPDGTQGLQVPDDIQRINQIQFDLQIFGLLLFIFRYVETLEYNRRMGEVLVMLRAMVADSIAVLAYMLLLAVVSGIAFSVGLPPAQTSTLPDIHSGDP